MLYNALLEAIKRDDVNIVQLLIDNQVGCEDGRLPVEPPVRARAFKVLELFLERGLDINETFRRNEPPVLSIPICTGDMKMVKWLLDHGANPNSRCEWDCTPASYAMFRAPLDIVKYLFEKGADPAYGELLQWAVIRTESNSLEVVRDIVEKGAAIDEIKYAKHLESFNSRKPYGFGTPLHRAAEHGKLDIVMYLLEKGANPLKLDSKEKTPRFWAEARGHAEVVRVLKIAEENHNQAA